MADYCKASRAAEAGGCLMAVAVLALAGFLIFAIARAAHGHNGPCHIWGEFVTACVAEGKDPAWCVQSCRDQCQAEQSAEPCDCSLCGTTA